MCKHTHPKGEGKVKGRTGDKDSGLRNSPQSQQDANSEEQVNSLRECVETLRSSQRDLRDTGKEVVSLRGPESRTGTVEAQPWRAGRALARHLQLRLASLPHPSLERTGEPVASAVSPLVSRTAGIL